MKLYFLLICNLGVMAFLFTPVMISLLNDWKDNPDYSHGYFIIPISLYLAWQKRHLLKPVPQCSLIPTFIPFIISLFFYFIFNVGDIAFLTRIFMILVFASYLIITLGYKNFLIFLFPVMYLVFMVPMPSSIMLPFSFPLRLFVSKTATIFAHSIDIPVLRQGNILNLPGGTLEVAPACSGLRSLVSLLALSALMGYMMQERIWKKCFCFISAVPVAIFTNILRVSISIILFQIYGKAAAEGLLHESLGLFIFLFSTVIIAIINFVVKKIQIL